MLLCLGLDTRIATGSCPDMHLLLSDTSTHPVFLDILLKHQFVLLADIGFWIGFSGWTVLWFGSARAFLCLNCRLTTNYCGYLFLSGSPTEFMVSSVMSIPFCGC
jgi:hypothetical protein